MGEEHFKVSLTWKKTPARNKEMGNVCQNENKLLAFYTTMKSTAIYYSFTCYSSLFHAASLLTGLEVSTRAVNNLNLC